MTTHEWHERNTDDELVYYRANHHAGRWSFQSRPKDEEDWVYHDEPTLEFLEMFRTVLWNKVQRRRAPEKHIDQIDALIEKAE